jgi:hypothetical protein
MRGCRWGWFEERDYRWLSPACSMSAQVPKQLYSLPAVNSDEAVDAGQTDLGSEISLAYLPFHGPCTAASDRGFTHPITLAAKCRSAPPSINKLALTTQR